MKKETKSAYGILKTYGTYIKNSKDKKFSRKREFNLHKNGFIKVTQFYLDENDSNLKKQVAERFEMHIDINGTDYSEAVYWIRYDYWAIPHAFVYAR